jgi:hypothetical protein
MLMPFGTHADGSMVSQRGLGLANCFIGIFVLGAIASVLWDLRAPEHMRGGVLWGHGPLLQAVMCIALAAVFWAGSRGRLGSPWQLGHGMAHPVVGFVLGVALLALGGALIYAVPRFVYEHTDSAKRHDARWEYVHVIQRDPSRAFALVCPQTRRGWTRAGFTRAVRADIDSIGGVDDASFLRSDHVLYVSPGGQTWTRYLPVSHVNGSWKVCNISLHAPLGRPA